MQKQQLTNKPDDIHFWRGIGGEFDNLKQIINEFVDNSISNFVAHKSDVVKNVAITFEQIKHNQYRVTIADSGHGISDLNAAFSIGTQDIKDSTLNEHGFGMKHALAAANPANDGWKVLSRNAKDEEFADVKSPYQYEGQIVTYRPVSEWPGPFERGTIVEFDANQHLIDTLHKGLRGNFQTLQTNIDILVEDLGYTYANFIQDGIVMMTVAYKTLDMGSFETNTVSVVKPDVEETILPGIGKTQLDLGNGEVTLEYEFSSVRESDYKKYYKANMSTMGVEIRINGRVLADNLFKEIWGLEKHNMYNYLLIQLNLVSDDPSRLPTTSTSKTSLRNDDPKLEKLYDWVKKQLPKPTGSASRAGHETELFDRLAEQLKASYTTVDEAAIVDRERYAFRDLDEKVRIDLYTSLNNRTSIYEGKKDITTPKDVYQLMMYWDGLKYDQTSIDKGYLVAAEHPESVKQLINQKNSLRDRDEKPIYDFTLKTWNELGIQYPN